MTTKGDDYDLSKKKKRKIFSIHMFMLNFIFKSIALVSCYSSLFLLSCAFLCIRQISEAGLNTFYCIGNHDILLLSLTLYSVTSWMNVFIFLLLSTLTLPDLTMYLYIFWITHVLGSLQRIYFIYFFSAVSFPHFSFCLKKKKNLYHIQWTRVNAKKMMMTTKLKFFLFLLFLLLQQKVSFRIESRGTTACIIKKNTKRLWIWSWK